MAAMTSRHQGRIGTWRIWKACLYTMMPRRVEVLCTRRDFAKSEIASLKSASEISRTAAQKTFWLVADTSACLCGHLHEPRLKGSRGIGKQNDRLEGISVILSHFSGVMVVPGLDPGIVPAIHAFVAAPSLP